MTKQSHVLQLREFESASIGAKWNTEQKVVLPSVAAGLERVQAELGIECLKITRRRVTALNYVGVVGFGDRAIEVLPKSDDADNATRRRLVEMLSIAGQMPHLDAGTTKLASSVPCLLDVFMQFYIRQLALEWRRGNISDYQKRSENRTCLRGKLLFHEQIRRNRLRPDRFFTRADEFVIDVPASQLLKAGLNACRRFAVTETTRREATALLPEFDGVTLRPFDGAELDAVHVDRRLARFETLLAMAKRFVLGCVPDRPGHISGYSLLFDMNVVFERYIGALLKRVCPVPYRAHLQASGRWLVLRGDKHKFALRPDVAIRRGRQFACLIDTKWKLLDPGKPHEGVRQPDMYQAYAYAKEFDCPCVILLYPRYGPLGPNVASYRLHPCTESSPRIDVCTVNISATPAVVAKELGQLLRPVLFHGVKDGVRDT